MDMRSSLAEAVQEQQYAVGIAPVPLTMPVGPSRQNSLEGFLWALVILGAVRLGRKQAEDKFLDYDALRVSPNVELCPMFSSRAYF